MPELVTLDQASLESFMTDLIGAGFEPVPGSDRRMWQGPIAAGTSALTSTTTMRVLLRDGWPFRHPHVLVEGLAVEHVNASGVVCLWPEDDNSRTWLTLAGLIGRLDAWAEAAEAGFRPQDEALDAYLAFDRGMGGMATFELDRLLRSNAHRGDWGRLHGIVRSQAHTELVAGSGSAGTTRGDWFHVGPFAAPPSNCDGLRALLTTRQKEHFDELLAAARTTPMLAVLVGERYGRQDVIVARLTAVPGSERVGMDVFEPADTGEATLQLRAGPDVDALSQRRVTCFGAGAVGSQLSLILSECGLGSIHLVDGELLRPGNVVRHAAGHPGIGFAKVDAVYVEINAHAPWTRVETTRETLWDPTSLAELMAGADAVVDATGVAPMTEQLSRLAERDGVVLITTSLYRGGAVGRVRRFRPGHDLPVHERGSDSPFPVIPADDANDLGQLEIGCSSPVNNASPASVIAVAALGAQMVVDAISARFELSADVIDVYRPLDEGAPFDAPGRHGFG